MEQNLDENATARRGFVFVEVDDRENVPADCFATEQMTEKASNVPKSIRLISMDGVVVLAEGFLKKLGPKAIEFREAFANEAEEFGVGPLLRAAFDDH